MASPAMENSENVEEVSEVQEVQGNKSWDDAMDEVEADHAKEQESQRTSLITPQRMMCQSLTLKKDDAQWS